MAAITGGRDSGIDVGRAVGVLLLVVCLGIIAGLTLVFVPHSGKTIQVEAIPGKHVIVPAILDGDVMRTRQEFSQLAAEGHPVYVSATKYSVTYMIKVESVSHRYNERILGNWGFYKAKVPLSIQGNMISLPLSSAVFLVAFSNFLAAIVMSVLAFVAIKQVPYLLGTR